MLLLEIRKPQLSTSIKIMAIDLSQYKVEVFPNINDKPVLPTATKPGNASHLINLHNGALDALQSGDSSSALLWQIVQGSNNPSVNSKLLCFNDSSDQCLLNLPQPQSEGEFIEILNVSPTMTIALNASSPEFVFWGTSTMGVTFLIPYEIVILIYTSSQGWVSNRAASDFMIEPGTVN